jgi:hypothetical protein
MAFADELSSLLPYYLVEPQKSRLKEALVQFYNRASESIKYQDFYKDFGHTFFLQSDLLKEIRFAEWDEVTLSFSKAYTDAIVISNTCDIASENTRTLNKKECLLAPLIDFQEYLNELEKEGYTRDRIKEFSRIIRDQLCTNIFYLPLNTKDNREYIAFFDNLFWFPSQELNSYVGEIEQTRITSLSQFGHYLFCLKLSYHLCRLPEQCDREMI